jgi:hypothetical protein
MRKRRKPKRSAPAHFQEQIPGFDGVFPDDLK